MCMNVHVHVYVCGYVRFVPLVNHLDEAEVGGSSAWFG
jgi:hypothetical protein